jgi:sugar/nucleoside kinase (ribokinase family)
MSILVVGSVAFDSVRTPFGEAQGVLGGSATYFSVASSYFTQVNLVAVVGEDFTEEHLAVFRERSINLAGLEHRPGQTFKWKGEYGFDLNEAHTLETCLNVFEDFDPQISAEYRRCPYVFLANIDPDIQRRVLDQVEQPKLVACDTMNFWIEHKLESLKETLKRVNLLIINEGEARELAKEPNLVKAANKILSWGPDSVIIKRGEYGALMFSDSTIFSAPAYPLESVYDPTGAGDSFAGGVMGYLAGSGDLTETGIRRAIIYGSVMASYNVEAFSLERLRKLSLAEIEARFREFKNLTHFEQA